MMTGPVGSSLGILGAVVFLGSLIWLHVRGFKDGAFPDVVLLLTGVSLIAYVVTKWERAKAPTSLALVGLLAAFVGTSSVKSPSPGERAIEASNRGVEAANREDFDQAIAHLTEAIRLNPQFAEAYYNRGLAFGKKNNLVEEIADYTEAIRLKPEFALAYYNRGHAFCEKGELDKAIEDFTGAIRLHPKDAPSYYSRGVAYEKKGEKARAEGDFAKAKKLGYVEE